ncbi:MAG: ATP-binding protein [Candidatus Kaiserbacteria bacterium]|nr:ATP-binding protein [Candidatus Kaiserbacteria bacterium]
MVKREKTKPRSKGPRQRSQADFTSTGRNIGHIDVRLSYRIIELFSEGLYASPNKAIEELVVNAFDANARRVQILLSSNLHEQNASIAVIDDGDGMDGNGLKQHWLIGVSDKRNRSVAGKKKRQQIGKFGIGKLATYVLAERLTHISRQGNKYYATSMDYTNVDQRVKDVEPKAPVRISLRQPTEVEVTAMLEPWTRNPAFASSGIKLFGPGSSKTWTVTIMSSLKAKVHEIKMGHLEWVLRTAMPLRPDFKVWLNDKELTPSKEGKDLLQKWILGKDLTELPRPADKGIEVSEDATADEKSGSRFGLNVPDLGRVTGYVEAYKDLLTGKSDELGRSHGFFVYIFDRLVNVDDGHFGISPDELRHGTFGRFRAVVHMDGLDKNLRANRETLQEGPDLEAARNVLRGIFNAARPTIEQHVEGEEPGIKLARKLAASPASLSRMPIVDLARAVAAGEAATRNLVVPEFSKAEAREAFIRSLEERAAKGDEFVAGLTIDYDGSTEEGIAKYDTETGVLRINAWHPFVATFYDDFSSKGVGQPLQLFAMAEVLAESHLHALGISQDQIDDFLETRDRLLRHLATDSGTESAFSIAASLREARNNPDLLEDRVCAAFRSLGFETTRLGKSGKPDGVASAILPGNPDGTSGEYSVSLEAKSKRVDGKKVASSTVKISSVVRHRDEFNCHHAVVVGPSFPRARGEDGSALEKEIDDDRIKTEAMGHRKTITLITVDDLSLLVRLRPIKQLGLRELRGLFDCRTPEESAAWVQAIQARHVSKPPYKAIINAIQQQQKQFSRSSVKYAALRVELSHSTPPVNYSTDEELMELCKALAQMAPGAMHANQTTVELDQSTQNVIAAIESAMRDYNDDDDGTKGPKK